VGVNNRNLKTFEVSLQTSMDWSNRIPSDFVKIFGRGISDPETLLIQKNCRFFEWCFLIGEKCVMKSARTASKPLYNFIKKNIRRLIADSALLKSSGNQKSVGCVS